MWLGKLETTIIKEFLINAERRKQSILTRAKASKSKAHTKRQITPINLKRVTGRRAKKTCVLKATLFRKLLLHQTAQMMLANK
jgi:hypothetical protein